ncbi:thioredoxin-like domain-containing protein [Sphingobacterium detergens]|uniref:Thiol-disulfide isomerase/thioredoxin n=1 Tax=Sphingobacterium detergens TaxID=1145106 RepID=A0A420AIQ6_SPHD1|nr:thioredoxin-like domain-containing protein [Sphingobacterium detergens]RKE44390.1 thiol-disulfide isomerase/thioredoxin [Sphingobacterium detergens]
MKVYIIALLLPLWLPCMLYAQKNFEPLSLTDKSYDQLNKKQPAKVTGKILNASQEDLSKIQIQYSIVNLIGPHQSKATIPLSADGTFEFRQTHNLPYQQVWFSLGDYVYTCLYLQDGLELIFDLEKLKKKNVYMIGDGISFAGKDAEVNRQMNEYTLFDKKHNPDFYKPLQKLEAKDPRFQQKLDSLFTIQRNTNTAFYKAYNTTFKPLIDAATDAEYTYKLLSYYLSNRIKKETIEEILVPIYSVSNETGNYLHMLNTYSRVLLYPDNKSRGDFVKVSEYISKIFPENYADIVNLRFKDGDIQSQNAIYSIILPKLKSTWAKENLRIEIKNLTAKQAKMKDIIDSAPTESKQTSFGTLIKELPFDATLLVNNTKSGAELIQTIKAKYPNKLVLLDIWATWCGPCLDQMPYGKKLHNQAKEAKLPVEFIYLCTDASSDQQKWVNKVAELEQPGTHLFVGNTVISELFTLFNRSGFPTYVVIKPNGEIDTKAISWMNGVTLEKLKEMMR